MSHSETSWDVSIGMCAVCGAIVLRINGVSNTGVALTSSIQSVLVVFDLTNARATNFPQKTRRTDEWDQPGTFSE